MQGLRSVAALPNSSESETPNIWGHFNFISLAKGLIGWLSASLLGALPNAIELLTFEVIMHASACGWFSGLFHGITVIIGAVPALWVRRVTPPPFNYALIPDSESSLRLGLVRRLCQLTEA